MFTEAIAGHSVWTAMQWQCAPWKKWEGDPSRTPGCSWGNPVVCHACNARRSPEHWAGWTVSPVLEMSPELGTQFSPGFQIRFPASQGWNGQPSKNRFHMIIFSWMWLPVEVWVDKFSTWLLWPFCYQLCQKSIILNLEVTETILRSLKRFWGHWNDFSFSFILIQSTFFFLFHSSATHISPQAWEFLTYGCFFQTSYTLLCTGHSDSLALSSNLGFAAKFRGSQKVKQNTFLKVLCLHHCFVLFSRENLLVDKFLIAW